MNSISMKILSKNAHNWAPIQMTVYAPGFLHVVVTVFLRRGTPRFKTLCHLRWAWFPMVISEVLSTSVGMMLPTVTMTTGSSWGNSWWHTSTASDLITLGYALSLGGTEELQNSTEDQWSCRTPRQWWPRSLCCYWSDCLDAV